MVLPEATEKKRILRALIGAVLTLIFLAAACVFLAGLGLSLRLPAAQTEEGRIIGYSPGFRAEDVLSGAKADALSGLTVVPKVYRLPENLLAGPEPDRSAFLKTQDPAEIRARLAECTALLGDTELYWNEGLTRYEPDGMRFYSDDSILCVTWTELDDQRFLTFAEIVIADGSQLRRKLASDVYGQGIMMFPTEMAAATNAVIAVSADFYRFRTMGVNVYQREVYRWDGEKVDTCFFDTKGDMHFVYAGEMTEKEQVERYVADNDITFCVSFGPILIDEGVNVAPARYYLGEVYETYPRCAIGQYGERHYLLCTVSRGALIGDVARFMEEKGCRMAYALDGGQSATIVVNNEQANIHTIYNSQRSQSDIIYFATAIPEDGGY